MGAVFPHHSLGQGKKTPACLRQAGGKRVSLPAHPRVFKREVYSCDRLIRGTAPRKTRGTSNSTANKSARAAIQPMPCPPKWSEKTGLWNAPAEILDKSHQRMATHSTGDSGGDGLTVARLCERFLAFSRVNHVPTTYDLYQHYLQSFSATHAKLLASAVRPFHLTPWLDAHLTWKAARRHAALAVKRAHSWADKQGGCSSNPVKQMGLAPDGRRPRVLSNAEQAEILGAIRDEPFRDFGRRPNARRCDQCLSRTSGPRARPVPVCQQASPVPAAISRLLCCALRGHVARGLANQGRRVGPTRTGSSPLPG